MGADEASVWLMFVPASVLEGTKAIIKATLTSIVSFRLYFMILTWEKTKTKQIKNQENPKRFPASC